MTAPVRGTVLRLARAVVTISAGNQNQADGDPGKNPNELLVAVIPSLVDDEGSREPSTDRCEVVRIRSGDNVFRGTHLSQGR